LKTIKTPIIPTKQTFAKVKAPHVLNKEAICIFMATGFFLDQDTYWKDEVVLRPASINTIDEEGFLIKSEPWFQWHYTPRDVGLSKTLENFTHLFEKIIDEQVGDQQVILPLSGGLDSRSQAVALKQLHKKVTSYSYSFKGGYPEAEISKKIANICTFDFKSFEIEAGYLWNCIEDLAQINHCYSEFTHPRQMAVIDEFEAMGEIFSLGHWGDVLFDAMCDKSLSSEEELELVIKKIVKKGGLSLASSLWKAWKLPGDFNSYFTTRVKELLDAIEIDNSSAKIRAFKSLYWAPRWTSINLAVFAEKRPITVPYYDDRMCQFICTVPEKYLANRQLQIEYIKLRNPKLAAVTWQENKPFNLYNYHLNKLPYNVPYRLVHKGKRVFNKWIGKEYVQRNWELQFVGEENETQLNNYLEDATFQDLISPTVTSQFLNVFKTGDKVVSSHPVSMLLTLALKMKSN